MADIMALAARAAEKLDYTTDSLEALAERDEAIDAVVNDRKFLRELDRIEFCCNRCEYWKPQRENATPDAAQWVCQECVRDDESAAEGQLAGRFSGLDIG